MKNLDKRNINMKLAGFVRNLKIVIAQFLLPSSRKLSRRLRKPLKKRRWVDLCYLDFID